MIHNKYRHDDYNQNTQIYQKILYGRTRYLCAISNFGVSITMYFDYHFVATCSDHQITVRREGLNKKSRLSVF